MLQYIPSLKFITNVETKYCKKFKKFVPQHFKKSYNVSVKAKILKSRYILLISVIKNNHDKHILQPIPSHKLIMDM